MICIFGSILSSEWFTTLFLYEDFRSRMIPQQALTPYNYKDFAAPLVHF